MAESHSVNQQKTEGAVHDVLTLQSCSRGDPDTPPCTTPQQNDDSDMRSKLKTEEQEEDTTHDKEPKKRSSESQIDRELDELMKQFLNGKINSAQMTRMMNKVITRTTTKGKVSERWESKSTEAAKPSKPLNKPYLSTRAETGTRSLLNLSTDKHHADSHAKSQPDVVNKTSRSPSNSSSGIIKSAENKRIKSGVTKHVRISEPEVAPLGSTGRLTSTRQRRNNLNKESSPPPNTTTEAKVRNICCHSNISCCTDEASAGVRGIETSTVSPHNVSSDAVSRSLTEQRDTQSPAVAEIGDLVRGKVSMIRLRFEEMMTDEAQKSPVLVTRRQSDG